MSHHVQYNQIPQPLARVNGADLITGLPASPTPPTPHELKLVQELFKQQPKGVVESLISEGKDLVVIGALFIIFSLPQIEDMLKKIIPSIDKSVYISLVVRAVIVMILYWFIKHFYLAKKH